MPARDRDFILGAKEPALESALTGAGTAQEETSALSEEGGHPACVGLIFTEGVRAGQKSAPTQAAAGGDRPPQVEKPYPQAAPSRWPTMTIRRTRGRPGQ